MPKPKLLILSLIIALQLTLPHFAAAATVGLPCTPEGDNRVALFTCVNQLYKYALVICSIAAVFMIILGGYLYIFSGGSDKKVATAKSFIWSSLLGITVLLTGFLLLKQINPNLLTIKNITPQQIGNRDWAKIDFGGGWNGTTPGTTYSGGRPVNTGQWKDLVNSTAQKYGIDPCILQAILEKESSGGNPNAIGHDGGRTASENFNSNSPPLYGLDWSHSHGIGMAQITIFKQNRWRDANTPSVEWFRTWYTVADLLNPQTNVDLAGKIMAAFLQDKQGDLRAVYGKYNGAGANSTYVSVIMGYYNTCKASQSAP